MRFIIIAVCALALAAPRAAAQHAVDRPPQPDYIVAPQDVLTINIFDQPALSAKYTVDADGTFAFPLIGRVKAAGVPLQGVEREVRDRLAGRFLKDPQVSVSVDQYHGRHVNVVGEVRQAGSYPITDDTTLLDALARAGSTTEHAGRVVTITRARRGNGGPVGTNGTDGATHSADVIRVDLGDLENGAPGKNIAIQDGDTVFVARADTFYVTGYVRTPGAYALQAPTTVLQAVALAGGLTDRGSDRRVQIIRQVDGAKKTLKANLDDLVQPGDTVVVRERLF